MASLILIQKLPSSQQSMFANKVNLVSNKLKIDPNWLMMVMYAESGLNPAAVNKISGATGLIQFMPQTAKSLGTTTDLLGRMSATTQMDYVYEYLKPYTGKIKSYFDLYLSIFFPAAIGKTDSYVFSTKSLSASTVAAQNPAINIDKDAKITMSEFKSYLVKTVPKALRAAVFGNPLLTVIVLIIISFLIVLNV